MLLEVEPLLQVYVGELDVATNVAVEPAQMDVLEADRLIVGATPELTVYCELVCPQAF
jgi:hypothetical protein